MISMRYVPFAVAISAVASAIACARAALPREAEPLAQEEAEPAPPAPEPAEPEAPPAPAGPRTVSIGGSGDILVHLKVARSALEFADEGGYQRVFGELRDVVSEDELAFVNLETPLSMRVPPETGDPPIMGAPAEVALALAAVGIDVASVANNHAYDQTALGMSDTLAALAAAEVVSVGAAAQPEGSEGPVFFERNGVRIGVLAFTERINLGPVQRDQSAFVARFDEERAAAAIARAREGGADVVVVSIHWSHDYVEQPLAPQRRRARFLVDAGADLILGHGPHVLQEVERLTSPRGEAVCAYSLGNLVSNQGLRYSIGGHFPANVHPAAVLPTTRDGAWLRVRFALDEERIRVDAIEAVPLWTHNNYVQAVRRIEPRLDIRIRPLRNTDERVRAERRPEIADALGSEVTLID
jgi:hypothetical protein